MEKQGAFDSFRRTRSVAILLATVRREGRGARAPGAVISRCCVPGSARPRQPQQFRVTYDPSPPHIFSCQSGRTRSAGGGIVRRTPGSLPWLRSRPALRLTRASPSPVT